MDIGKIEKVGDRTVPGVPDWEHTPNKEPVPVPQKERKKEKEDA